MDDDNINEGELESGELEPVNPFNMDPAMISQILGSRRGKPHWDDDEEDYDEFTEEEIANDPSKRILWAAENNNLDAVREILEKDREMMHSCDQDGYTALHRAAYSGHLAMVEYLLEHGAEINRKTNDGWTPCHSACRWSNTAIASLLLQNGANVNAQTNGGLTALHLASANRDSQETLELLLTSRYIDPNIKNNAGETALQICQRSNSHYHLFEIVEPRINVAS